MASSKTDFLKFSAYSIKELITRKLSEDTKFTDQVYEGSNLAILIDIVSYMYQCLIYNLNNTASESMFMDTQIYENMNRLVSFLGYSPRGIRPSELNIQIVNENGPFGDTYVGYRIPKYAAIDTGLTDPRGNKIYFSTIKDHVITSEHYYNMTLVNGVWKKYYEVLDATGEDFETFKLNIGSSIADKMYTADNGIEIYVLDPDTGLFDNSWTAVNDEIFLVSTDDAARYKSIYNDNDKVYQIRLDENKNYVLKFGNGIIGKKLKKGSRIYVFYLETNGLDANFTIDDVVQTKFKFTHTKSLFGITTALYNSIFGISDDDDVKYYMNDLIEQNILVDSRSSTPKADESVDDIRANAPVLFKIGNRLVTKSDYEFYMKDRYASSLIDVKCYNNYDYCTKFYKWLAYYANLKHADVGQSYYINPTKLSLRNYNYADPSDSNDVYLWLRFESGIDTIKKSTSLKEQVMNIKSITTEVNFLTPIVTHFAICADSNDARVINQINQLDSNYNSYIEVTINDNSVYSSTQIKTLVQDILFEYFKETNMSLGQLVDFNDILQRIYAINGIKNVRTVFEADGEQRIVNGLSFASWSDFIDAGDDLDVSTISRKLLDFQFPEFDKSSVKITVIKKSIANTYKVQY